MITDIRLQNFRSYKDDSFEIGPNVNIIVGPNASGKTNLLEAVQVVARGESYRAKDAELIGFASSWMRLDAHTPHQTRVVKVKAGLVPMKTFEIDDQTYKHLPQPKQLPVTLFEPDHMLLLTGSPDLRRNYLDEVISQTVIGYEATTRQYRRVLAQRNSLLKHNPRDLKEQLFVWNLRLSELGGKIARERFKLAGVLSSRAAALYGSLSGDAKTVALAYESRFSRDGYETELLRKLENGMHLDVLRGFTAYGPHRDDLGVYIDGHRAAEAASRGETRTIVLVMKIVELQLLEAARKVKPLLLLDDVFSELDTKRRQALTGYVGGYQTFITTTDADAVLHHFSDSTIIPLVRV